MTDFKINKRWYLLCFGALFTMIIVILSSTGISSSEPLTITSISPDFYINSSSKEVTIKGSGFDPNTEAFIFGGGTKNKEIRKSKSHFEKSLVEFELTD